MSVFTLTYFSKSIPGCTQVNVILPIGAEYEDLVESGEKFQTLWLLHGGGGNFSEWARYTSIEKLAMLHKFAVVMPDGGSRSWYNDMPGGNNQMYTYITEELPAFLRKHFPLSDKREDNFIAGLSMGSQGAAKIGFNNPDKYCAVGILSGGPLNLWEFLAKQAPEEIANFETHVLGPLNELPGTINDVWKKFAELKDSGYPMPLIYDACGRQDHAYKNVCKFRDYVKEIGMEDYVIFEEADGVHSWEFWDEYIAKFVDLLPLKNRGFWRKWYDLKHGL